MATRKKASPGNGSGKPVKPRPAIPPYDFGKTLPEAVSLFGEAVVLHCFTTAARAQWGEALRAIRDDGEPLTDAEIQMARETWKPSVRLRGDAPAAKASKITARLSAEEKAALLAALREG